MDANAKQVLNDMFTKCEDVIHEARKGVTTPDVAFYSLMWHITKARMNPHLFLEMDKNA